MKKRVKSVVCVIAAMLLFLDTSQYVQADKISDLKEKNKQDQEKLDEIGDKLNELEGEQSDIKSEMNDVEAELADIIASIEILEEEIEQKKADIKQAEIDLAAAQAEEKKQYDAMCIRIKMMYERGESSYLDLFMTSSSMNDALNKADYIEELYDYDRKLLKEYQDTCKRVEELKETLEEEQSELEAQQDEYQEEQKGKEEILSRLKAESDDYELQISKAKQQATVYKTQIKQQNAQIAKLEEEARKAAEEAARKRAEEEARKKAEEEAKKKAEQAGQNNSSQSNKNSESTATEKPKQTVDTSTIMSANGSEQGKQIAAYACQFIGNPYVAGGTSLTNGTDCSGFTQAVYRNFGYSIPRNSYSQRETGREVSFAEAQPGDLICYAGHVAMYIGNGKIVHASSAKTGIKISNATYREILSVRRIVQ